MRYFSLTTLLLLSLLSTTFAKLIDVSQPYEAGTFTLHYGTRFQLSSGSIIDLKLQDRTVILNETDIKNKLGLLAFIDTISTVTYVEDSNAIDTLPVYQDTLPHDSPYYVRDTLGIYPAIEAYEIYTWPDIFRPVYGSEKPLSISIDGANTVRLTLICGRRKASITWETDSMGNGIFKSDNPIDVSTPYSSGTITLSQNKRTYLSNEATLYLSYADKTPYTGIGYNGDVFLSFLNPKNRVSYADYTSMDTTLFFTKDPNGEIDTIGSYPAFPVIGQDVIVGELVTYPAEGFDKEFCLKKWGHHTLRCYIDSSNLNEIKWETDSLGNGIFPSDICDSVTETVYDTFSVWACINYPYRSTPNIEYTGEGIKLMHNFQLEENEHIRYVEITEDNEFNEYLARVGTDSNMVYYDFRVYKEIEQFRENKEEREDSFSYAVYIKNIKTNEKKKYIVKNHVIFYLTHVHTLKELETKQQLNNTIHDKITIYSLNGRIVKTLRNCSLSNINTRNLSTGHYILSYTVKDKLMQKKFFVQ